MQCSIALGTRRSRVRCEVNRFALIWASTAAIFLVSSPIALAFRCMRSSRSRLWPKVRRAFRASCYTTWPLAARTARRDCILIGAVVRAFIRCPTQELEHAEEVPVWSLRTLWSRLPMGEIGLVKVDVEGAEIEMFQAADATILRRARQYTVEFHDFLWNERVAEVGEIFQKFRAAGFVPLRFSRDNSNVVFLRRDWLPAGQLGRLWLMGPVKIGMGLVRILRRRKSARGV